MAKVPLPYRVGNKLADFIAMERAKRTLASETQVLLSEIENELADYCSLSKDGIKAIKNLKSSTSLPVALKIAKYFDVTITEIFPLIDEGEEEAYNEITKFGVRKRVITCDEPNCDEPHYAKGMCRGHYHENYSTSN